MGIRVQAKRLHRDQQSYKEIAYVQRNGTRQIDLLIDRAHARQRYAFYCLYNAWDIPGPLLPWNCRSFQPMPQPLGCSLAAAPKVRDLIDQGVGNVQDFGPIMFPWSCLVCCTGCAPQTASLAQRASAFFQNKYGDEIPNVDMIHRESPRYVSDLMNGEPPIGFDEPGIGYILVVNED